MPPIPAPDESGYTQAQRASDLPGIPAFIEHGALLGHLWMEGQLGVGDPLVNQGAPTRPLRRPATDSARKS